MSCNSCIHMRLDGDWTWYCELTGMETSHCDWCTKYEAAISAHVRDQIITKSKQEAKEWALSQEKQTKRRGNLC